MQSYEFTPIGVIHSPYQQKFGIPRQPFLAPDIVSTIELFAPYNQPDCVRGLEEFEYVWVQFVFHGNLGEGWAPLVRPPRLGGKEKKGVFATRSPHRPNPIGLSLVKLISINTEKGVVLTVSGADLMEGTPILDIKPYITFVEAKPQAKSGFAEEKPLTLKVNWSDRALSQLQILVKSSGFQIIVEQTLAQDPRPAFHEDNRKEYGVLIDGVNVKFKVESGVVEVIELL